MSGRAGRTRARLGWAAGLSALALLTACTTVPSSSSPQIIEQVPVTPASSAGPGGPAKGADPLSIVNGFLEANASPQNAAAPNYLSGPAHSHWSNSTATVFDSYTVAASARLGKTGSTATVDVTPDTGSLSGTVSDRGVFTPLRASGSAPQPLEFGLTKVNGQWLITQIPLTGVLIDAGHFRTSYRMIDVYFFDQSTGRLAADPRYYPAASDPSQLATWLVQQLLTGPANPSLSASISEIAQTAASSVTATVATTGATRVELPGISQYDQTTLRQFADEIAATLASVSGIGAIGLTDGGRPVPIGSATTFTTDLAHADLPQAGSASNSVYYVRNPGPHGALIQQSGQPIAGALGDGDYGLESVALAGGDANATPASLAVAGVAWAGSGSTRLWIGTGAHLSRTSIVGRAATPLSRPSWAPALSGAGVSVGREAWIGVGSGIERVTTDGRVLPVQITGVSGGANSVVSAVQVSPDGSRVLLVISSSGGGSTGNGQLYVGVVVRSATTVQIQVGALISPPNVQVIDASWNAADGLYVVGRATDARSNGLYTVQLDGWNWTAQTTSGLPTGGPDTIAVSPNGPPWASSGNTVWQLINGFWTSPSGGSDSSGVAPTYLQ